MFNKWLKPFLPRSLFGRAMAILVVPIVLIQVIVSIVFIQRLFEDVTRQMTNNVVIEINFILQKLDAAENLHEADVELQALSKPLSMSLTLQAPAVETIGTDDWNYYDISSGYVVEVLRNRVNDIHSIDLKSSRGLVLLQVHTPHGLLDIQFSRRRVSATNPHQLLVIMVFSSILLTLIAMIFLRNQIRPIRRLAKAAEAFGKGRSVSFRPKGAAEVRSAGNAFLAMRARIERQIEQRTLMLSGVSHDLRTPLTRMKLSLSLQEDDPEIKLLRKDVDEMGRMLDEFLAFARGDGGEDISVIRPCEIARTLATNAARSGITIDLKVKGEIDPEPELYCRKMAVQRALENLINNAARYGTTISLTVSIAAKFVDFIVEDDGPGILAARHEEALRPFARLDTARNQDQGGGVGLGLTITADIARSHGGTFTLSQSQALGGLRADFRIPR